MTREQAAKMREAGTAFYDAVAECFGDRSFAHRLSLHVDATMQWYYPKECKQIIDWFVEEDLEAIHAILTRDKPDAQTPKEIPEQPNNQ